VLLVYAGVSTNIFIPTSAVMALNRILLPVLMIASTTAVLLNDANEDKDQSMVAELSTLKSQMQSLHQENAGLKLRVQLKDLQAEVAALRRENSMLQRQGKVLVGGVQEGDWVWLAGPPPWNHHLKAGTIGKILKFGPSQGLWVEAEEGERESRVNGNIDLQEGEVGVYWLMEGKIDGAFSKGGKVKLELLEKIAKKMETGSPITVRQAVLENVNMNGVKYAKEDGMLHEGLRKEGCDPERGWEAAKGAADKCWKDGGFKLMKTPEDAGDPDDKIDWEGEDFWNVECEGKVYAFGSDFISVPFE